MKTWTNPLINRGGWPAGIWDSEPDKAQWKDEATGLPCIAVRAGLGHWCGYVGVPRGHVAFEIAYSRVDVRVHCGLTYAAHCVEGAEDSSICHVPEPGEPDDVWWLGFDCAHYIDKGPRDDVRGFDPHRKYRTLEWVREETARLAAQVAVLTEVSQPEEDV